MNGKGEKKFSFDSSTGQQQQQVIGKLVITMSM